MTSIRTFKGISKTVYKVSDFLSWQRSRSLELSPSFQRRSVWPAAAKSLLIDTVVRGVPMPIIFIRERIDLETYEPIREVVDGQQRLRTLITYIEPGLLRDLDIDRDLFTVKKVHNPEIANKKFAQLEKNIKERILNYDFSVHVLPSDTEDADVLQIFARMNSTGVKLNQQELRNAKYFGEFKETAYSLAYEQLNRWRDWGIFSEANIARMDEVDETSDLILTMLVGVHAKSKTSLDKIYEDNEEEFAEKHKVASHFRNVMDKIEETLGDVLANTEFHRRPLFHSLFTFYYNLIYGSQQDMGSSRIRGLPPNMKNIITQASQQVRAGNLDEDLANALRGATANRRSREARLEFLRQTMLSSI